jgi:hypothetical protein
MRGLPGLFAVAIGAGLALAALPGAVAAADFGDSTYGMEAPYIQGDLTGDIPVAVAHRYRQPPVIYPPADYQQGIVQYPDQSGVYLQEPLPPRPNGRCLQSFQIERMLSAQGWRNFVNPQRGVDVVGLTASRPNGLTYRLKLDRCTGVIVSANLLDQPDQRRSYSYNPDAPPPGY